MITFQYVVSQKKIQNWNYKKKGTNDNTANHRKGRTRVGLNFSHLSIGMLPSFLHIEAILVFFFAVHCFSFAFFCLGRLLFQVFLELKVISFFLKEDFILWRLSPFKVSWSGVRKRYWKCFSINQHAIKNLTSSSVDSSFRN